MKKCEMTSWSLIDGMTLTFCSSNLQGIIQVLSQDKWFLDEWLMSQS